MIDERHVRLAYFAGIIDGEGCIAIHRSKPVGSRRTPGHVALLMVGNTDRPLIEDLAAAFRVGCVAYRAGTEKREPCYVWTTQSRNAAVIVKALRPFMRVKAAQADVLLEFVNSFESFKGGRLGHKGGIPVPASVLAKRDALYLRMRELNRVGPRGDEPRVPTGKKSVGITAVFFADLRARGLLDRDRLDLVPDLDSPYDVHS